MRCIRRSQVSGLVVARGILLRLPRYAFIAFFYASLFSLAACSLDNNSNKSAVAPPPAVKQETIAPIPSAMDTFRALAPPDGLKFTPLFNEQVGDNNARMKRLEDAVQVIRNDVDTLAPTMVRMVAIEKDIKGLVAQLQTITDQQGQVAPAPFTPAGTPSKLPPKLPQQGGTPIPGEDVAKGTEPAKADEAKAGPIAPSLLVTPEAASKGELPPKGAASPNSETPAAVAPTSAPPQGLNLTPKAETPAAPVNKSEAAPQPQTEEDKVEEIATEGAPAAAPSGSVVNMHISDAKDKTELVLDVTSDAKAPVKMINNGKTLVINLAHFAWGGHDTWEADHKKLISGGYVKDGKLYVQLKRASQFTAQKIQPPSDDEKNYRLVIDLTDKNLSGKKVQKAEAPRSAAPAAAKAIAAPAPAPATTPAPAAEKPAAPPKPVAEDFP